jgi:hypothetical protein
LSCSGNAKGGFAKGKYHFIVGDSASGKTWLSLTCLAEAAMNPEFENYRFIYDNVEDGALMDIERFFGSKVAERIESPAIDEDGLPDYSSTDCQITHRRLKNSISMLMMPLRINVHSFTFWIQWIL